MAARFVNVDHDTPLLLPPDLRQWVPKDHLVRFIMDAVGEPDLRAARVNGRGPGREQYPPRLRLGLLVYSDATGVFSSRASGRASCESVAARLLCADTPPDHDALRAFRRQNGALLAGSFAQVVERAARCGGLQVGGIPVAVDGAKVLASASKHSAVSFGHAGESMGAPEGEVAQLLAKAQQADGAPLEDGLSIPAEIQRRAARGAKLAPARAEMEARTLVRAPAPAGRVRGQGGGTGSAAPGGQKAAGRGAGMDLGDPRVQPAPTASARSQSGERVRPKKRGAGLACAEPPARPQGGKPGSPEEKNRKESQRKTRFHPKALFKPDRLLGKRNCVVL